PSQTSGASHGPCDGSPHAVPTGAKPLSWHRPEAQVSWLMHEDPVSPQNVPSAAWFALQVPAPSQASGLSQAPVDGSPQAGPGGTKPLLWQAPARQVFWLVQAVAGPPHGTPSGAMFGLHTPAPSQVSAPSHAWFSGSPHEVPAGAAV